jgi:hypothetical protein
MTRQRSGDTPSRIPRYRRGVVRAILNSQLITVDIGNATVTAHADNAAAVSRGDFVDISFHPDIGFWKLLQSVQAAPAPGGWLVGLNWWSTNDSTLQFVAWPITEHGFGEAILSAGPPDADTNSDNSDETGVAFHPSGGYLVAAWYDVANYDAFISLHAWDDVTHQVGPVIDSVNLVSGGLTFWQFDRITISINGDLIVTGSGSGSGPMVGDHMRGWPTSISGFGTEVSVGPDMGGLGGTSAALTWHPSGQAIFTDSGIWRWSNGFGAQFGTGRFAPSPNGNWVVEYIYSPAAAPGFRVRPFDLATGVGNALTGPTTGTRPGITLAIDDSFVYGFYDAGSDSNVPDRLLRFRYDTGVVEEAEPYNGTEVFTNGLIFLHQPHFGDTEPAAPWGTLMMGYDVFALDPDSGPLPLTRLPAGLNSLPVYGTGPDATVGPIVSELDIVTPFYESPALAAGLGIDTRILRTSNEGAGVEWRWLDEPAYTDFGALASPGAPFDRWEISPDGLFLVTINPKLTGSLLETEILLWRRNADKVWGFVDRWMSPSLLFDGFLQKYMAISNPIAGVYEFVICSASSVNSRRIQTRQFSAAGWGLFYAVPSSLSSNIWSPAWHPTTGAIAFARTPSGVTRSWVIYPFTPGTGYGTAYTDPTFTTDDNQFHWQVAFDPTGNWWLGSHQITPAPVTFKFHVRPFSIATGLGSRTSDPGSYDSGTGTYKWLAFGMNAIYQASTSDGVSVYAFSQATGAISTYTSQLAGENVFYTISTPWISPTGRYLVVEPTIALIDQVTGSLSALRMHSPIWPTSSGAPESARPGFET